MEKKILVVATSDIHLQVFHLPYIEMLKAKGCRIDVAVEVRGNGIVPFADHIYDLPFKRTLLTIQLVTAYRRLKNLIDEGNYDLIHCHTPIPSAITRLAAQDARRKGTILMYTSHGFHFYKGGPPLSGLFFYTIEKYLSSKTDVIIAINEEDYQVAKGDFKAKETFYMRGIGVDTSRFQPDVSKSKEQLKVSMGYQEDNFILLYAANFIPRKNHVFILRALLQLRRIIPQIKVLFAGSGFLLDKMKAFVEANSLSENVDFLGFRKDIGSFLAIADISISASKHEGLGLALAEAMFCGVPVVATVDRGHKEMIEHNFNGFLFEQENTTQFIEYITLLYRDRKLASVFADRSKEKIQTFSIENSLEFMNNIYSKYIGRA